MADKTKVETVSRPKGRINLGVPLARPPALLGLPPPFFFPYFFFFFLVLFSVSFGSYRYIRQVRASRQPVTEFFGRPHMYTSSYILDGAPPLSRSRLLPVSLYLFYFLSSFCKFMVNSVYESHRQCYYFFASPLLLLFTLPLLQSSLIMNYYYLYQL